MLSPGQLLRELAVHLKYHGKHFSADFSSNWDTKPRSEFSLMTSNVRPYKIEEISRELRQSTNLKFRPLLDKLSSPCCTPFQWTFHCRFRGILKNPGGIIFTKNTLFCILRVSGSFFPSAWTFVLLFISILQQELYRGLSIGWNCCGGPSISHDIQTSSRSFWDSCVPTESCFYLQLNQHRLSGETWVAVGSNSCVPSTWEAPLWRKTCLNCLVFKNNDMLWSYIYE